MDGKSLIFANTSYAGMGPYVVNIVNSFTVRDNVYFFLVENENRYYTKNIKSELKDCTTFFLKPENKIKTTINVFFPIKPSYYCELIQFCEEQHIKTVYIITGCYDSCLIKFLRKRGIKIIIAVHDLHPHESKKNFILQLRHKMFYYKTFNVMWMCDEYVTNDIEQFNELKNKVGNKPVYFHEFPTLVTSSIANGNKIPREFDGNLDLRYVLFFGRIEEYKGVRMLYDLFMSNKYFNGINLVIAGSGSIPFERKSSEREHGILVINRYIEDEEVRFLYTHASCVVYPYISATQSGVLSLAYYFRTPTLVSDIPFFRGIIERSKGGVCFSNGNVSSLEEKLLDVLSQKNDYSYNQEAYYNSYYSHEKIKEKLLNILK